MHVLPLFSTFYPFINLQPLPIMDNEGDALYSRGISFEQAYEMHKDRAIVELQE